MDLFLWLVNYPNKDNKVNKVPYKVVTIVVPVKCIFTENLSQGYFQGDNRRWRFKMNLEIYSIFSPDAVNIRYLKICEIFVLCHPFPFKWFIIKIFNFISLSFYFSICFLSEKISIKGFEFTGYFFLHYLRFIWGGTGVIFFSLFIRMFNEIFSPEICLAIKITFQIFFWKFWIKKNIKS